MTTVSVVFCSVLVQFVRFQIYRAPTAPMTHPVTLYSTVESSPFDILNDSAAVHNGQPRRAIPMLSQRDTFDVHKTTEGYRIATVYYLRKIESWRRHAK